MNYKVLYNGKKIHTYTTSRGGFFPRIGKKSKTKGKLKYLGKRKIYTTPKGGWLTKR